MNEKEFRETLETLNEKSGNDLEEYLERFEGEPETVSLLTGSEYDAIGLGRKSVRKVAQRVYDFEDDKGTLTESLAVLDGDGDGNTVGQLYLDIDMLNRKSGGDQKDFLEGMFEDYEHPSIVSYAVLNDWALGFTDNSVARALGLKESLPFYETVVDAMRDDEPLTEPQVGKAFSPMLAKSESSLPDDLDDLWAQPKLDGYRILIHVSDEVKAYSRRQNDVTESLPELQEVGWPDGEYIFDGEVIAEDGTYKSTSERVGKKAENVTREQDMKFGLFDVLVDNGEHVHDEPLSRRYDRLHEIAGRAHGSDMGTHLSTEPKVWNLTAYSDVPEEDARHIGRNYEGLIWKDPEAEYKFDKRSKAWVKEKNQSEEVDVVVSGFHEGNGRLDGTLGKLTVESGDGVPLGNVGTGFSDEQRDRIWESRDEWVGKTIELTAEAYDEGLRFPRFERDRSDDGEPDDIDRIKELLEI